MLFWEIRLKWVHTYSIFYVTSTIPVSVIGHTQTWLIFWFHLHECLIIFGPLLTICKTNYFTNDVTLRLWNNFLSDVIVHISCLLECAPIKNMVYRHICPWQHVNSRVVWMPWRSKDIHRLWEHVVVHEARIDREQTHQQDDVATTEDDSKYLQRIINNGQLVL